MAHNRVGSASPALPGPDDASDPAADARDPARTACRGRRGLYEHRRRPIDILAYALLDDALLPAGLLLRLLPWIMEAPLSASYWAFSFGVTALPSAAIRMAARGDTGPAAQLAPYLFAFANLEILAPVILPVGLLARGRLLSPAPPTSAIS